MSLGIQNNYYSENGLASVAKRQQVGSKQETSTKQLSFVEVDRTKDTKAMTPEEEMAIFKKEFYAELNMIPRDRTIANVAINISEEAFKNMKDDPKYREQMLAVIRRDMTGSVAPAPDCSVVITVGATAKDYRADGWSVNNDSEFYARSQNSFYKAGSSESKKSKQKQLMEEYLAKRQEEKRIQKELLEEKAEKKERTQEYFKRKDAERAYNNQVIIQKEN